MKQFEVGRLYEAADRSYPHIIVMKRTAKSIRVYNGENDWWMRIKTDENGNEYAVDSCVPKSWRSAFTYKAEWEV